MIETRQALYFTVVAEELHFGRAAQRLRISQPPLSQAIRQLERQVGATLLHRTTREVTLTNAGREFLAQCRIVLAAADRAAAVASQAHAGQAGTLRIGAVTSAFSSSLPAILERFQSARPNVELRMWELDTHHGLVRLRHGELDVAIIRFGGAERNLITQPLRRDHLVLAVPAQRAPRRQDPVDLADFADEPWVWFPRHISPEYHDELVTACRAGGFSPNGRHWANSIQSQIAMVACGLGVTLVPHTSATETAAVAYLPLRTPVQLVELALVRRRDAGPLADQLAACADPAVD